MEEYFGPILTVSLVFNVVMVVMCYLCSREVKSYRRSNTAWQEVAEQRAYERENISSEKFALLNKVGVLNATVYKLQEFKDDIATENKNLQVKADDIATENKYLQVKADEFLTVMTHARDVLDNHIKGLVNGRTGTTK